MTTWFHFGATAFAVAMMLHEVYSLSWKPAMVPGAYEVRKPGEFAADKKQYMIERLEDEREFSFGAPAPEPSGLIRFSNPYNGTIYIQGRPAGKVSAGEKAGCPYFQIGGVMFTRAGCPV